MGGPPVQHFARTTFPGIGRIQARLGEMYRCADASVRFSAAFDRKTGVPEGRALGFGASSTVPGGARMPRAAVVTARHAPVEVRDVPTPDLEDTGMLAEVEAATLC